MSCSEPSGPKESSSISGDGGFGRAYGLYLSREALVRFLDLPMAVDLHITELRPDTHTV
jgi:hypothetical protein